jgi:streptogramin lyase
LYDFDYVAQGDERASVETDAEAADRVRDALPGIGDERAGTRPSDCDDAGLTSSIYVVTQQEDLLSFDPLAATFTLVGKLDCPGALGNPFSMAVDRQGTAYVVYSGGGLFRVSTRTAACTTTPLTMQPGFATFGMAFLDRGGPTDTLYIATDGVPAPRPGPSELATIDLSSFQVTVVGPLSLTLAELTGSPDGRLFAYYGEGTSSAIAQVDPDSTQLVANSDLPGLSEGAAWAFGYWGGDFYIFTAPAGTSVVHRFRPSDRSVVQVAQLNATIFGAGVSTCAPSL